MKIGCQDKLLEYEKTASSKTDRDLVAIFILGMNGLAAFLFPAYRAYLAVSNSKMRFSTLCTRFVRAPACVLAFVICSYSLMHPNMHAHV